jgi:hypothetical protein
VTQDSRPECIDNPVTTILTVGNQRDEWIRTFAIITTNGNELVAEIHDRMPLIVPPVAYARWLGEEPDPHDFMQPFPSAPMRMWPRGKRVLWVMPLCCNPLDERSLAKPATRRGLLMLQYLLSCPTLKAPELLLQPCHSSVLLDACHCALANSHLPKRSSRNTHLKPRLSSALLFVERHDSPIPAASSCGKRSHRCFPRRLVSMRRIAVTPSGVSGIPV